jgi:phosphohistidine phosphatase
MPDKNINFELMKTLYLIRHAKASDGEADMPDEKRTLVKKGINNIQKVIQYLLAQKISFDCIISSHATRALETAKIIAEGTEYPVEKIVCDKRIYNNDASVYFNVLYELDDSVSAAAIVGHNPAISELANYFLEDKIMSLPTSGVVSIEIDTERWTDINLAAHKMKFIITPKML